MFQQLPKKGKFRCNNVKTSCCNPAAMDEMQANFANERRMLIHTAERIQNITTQQDMEVNDLQSGLDKAIDKLKDFLDNLPFRSEDPVETRLKELSKVLKKMMLHTKRWVQETLSAYGKCLDTTLQYNAGITCLACDAEWTKFIFYNETESMTLRLSNSTCDTFDHGCRGLWQAATKYMKALRKDAEDARKIRNITDPLPAVLTENQMCGGKPCRELVCRDMVKGLIFHAPLAYLARVLNHTSTAYETFKGADLVENRRRELSTESEAEYLAALAEASSVIAEVAQTMSKSDPFLGLVRDDSFADRRREEPAADDKSEITFAFTYADDGYYATDAGKLYAQGVDTDSDVEGVAVCPDADDPSCNTAFSVSPAVSAIVCVLIAAVAAF